jgi:TolB-like protein
MLKTELSLADSAANSVAALPAKSDAPPARVARRNSLRLMPLQIRSWSAEETSSFIARNLDSDGIFSLSKLRVTSFRSEKHLLAAECEQLVPRIDAFAYVHVAP